MKPKSASSSPSSPSSSYPYVIVRTYSAGVHCGELVERNGKEVLLANARRIWSWEGAASLSEIAVRGAGAGSKLPVPVASIVLTEAIEVTTCSREGEVWCRTHPVWSAAR
jgi:hypothetical protein